MRAEHPRAGTARWKRGVPAGLVLLRLGMAAVFIGAAIPKIAAPDLFALSVHNYQMLPSWGVNALAILLFLHADTRLPQGAFRRVGETLVDDNHVAGAFDLRYSSARLSMRLIARVACLRSRLTRIPYGDQAQFFRRDYFEKISGFADIPLMEDVEIMRRVKERGDRISILHEAVVTSARRQEKEGIVYCTLRNWTIVTLYLLGMSPEWLVRFYKNH